MKTKIAVIAVIASALSVVLVFGKKKLRAKVEIVDETQCCSSDD